METLPNVRQTMYFQSGQEPYDILILCKVWEKSHAVFISYLSLLKNLSTYCVSGTKLDDRDILDLKYCVGYTEKKNT